MKLTNGADYGFFDDPYTLARKGYAGEDRLSLLQFLVMGAVFLLLVAISFALKNKKERLFFLYKILAVVMPVFEVIKITYSTYFDLLNDEGFNWGGILPLYTCSLLLYLLPFVAWGKGRTKECAMAFFSSIGIVAGLSNFVYLSSAGSYPIFSYGCFYSITYHAVLVFMGLSLMISGIYLPTKKTVFDAMIPIVLFSAIVIPANFIIEPVNSWADYMLLMDANGFAYIGDFADFLGAHNLRILFSLLMVFVAYPLATALINAINMGILRLHHSLVERVAKRFGGNKDAAHQSNR